MKESIFSRMIRSYFTILLIILTVGSNIGIAASRPNIVVLMTDDQDIRSMEVMTRVQAIAPNATIFSNNFVSNPLCCPSRATFLTGQYAHNHGVMSNTPPDGGYKKLDHSNTLPVWLQKAGYYTAHIGKYLNGYGYQDTNPNDDIPAEKEIPAGWNEWYGMLNYSYYNYNLNENGNIVFYGDDADNYQTDVYARKAIDFIQKRSSDSTPFFLSIAFLSPHDDTSIPPGPEPAKRHKGVFNNKPLPQPPSFNEADMSDKPFFMQALPLMDSDVIETITVSYRRQHESLLAVDESVEKIINTLNDTGKLNNTVLIFTSDNGFFHGEHRKPSEKELLYEEAIRVPLIIYIPGLSHGQTINKLVANIDLAPTIVELAGASTERVMDGLSLLPLFTGHVNWRTSILIEGKETIVKWEDGKWQERYAAVRTDRYIYGEHFYGLVKEFYDLYRDPYQLRSLHNSPSPAHQQIIRELKQRLAILGTCSGTNCNQFSSSEP